MTKRVALKVLRPSHSATQNIAVQSHPHLPPCPFANMPIGRIFFLLAECLLYCSTFARKFSHFSRACHRVSPITYHLTPLKRRDAFSFFSLPTFYRRVRLFYNITTPLGFSVGGSSLRARASRRISRGYFHEVAAADAAECSVDRGIRAIPLRAQR